MSQISDTRHLAHADADFLAIDRLEDVIDKTAPQTIVGAVVKLRRLADPNQLLCNGDLACTSARQVLGLVERLIRNDPPADF
jgi:hypothetical protein